MSNWKAFFDLNMDRYINSIGPYFYVFIAIMFVLNPLDIELGNLGNLLEFLNLLMLGLLTLKIVTLYIFNKDLFLILKTHPLINKKILEVRFHLIGMTLGIALMFVTLIIVRTLVTKQDISQFFKDLTSLIYLFSYLSIPIVYFESAISSIKHSSTTPKFLIIIILSLLLIYLIFVFLGNTDLSRYLARILIVLWAAIDFLEDDFKEKTIYKKTYIKE